MASYFASCCFQLYSEHKVSSYWTELKTLVDITYTSFLLVVLDECYIQLFKERIILSTGWVAMGVGYNCTFTQVINNQKCSNGKIFELHFRAKVCFLCLNMVLKCSKKIRKFPFTYFKKVMRIWKRCMASKLIELPH